MRSMFSAFMALFSWVSGRQAVTTAEPVPVLPEVPQGGDPPWLKLARADLGIREFPGVAANPAIMRAWQYCDYAAPKGDETAWCSAKSCEWMERSGQPSTRAPNARSWLKWGHELKAPKPGCVAVFWRDSPSSWEGHVGLYLGPGDQPGTAKILGGNQGNAVSIAEFPLAQLLGWRWPTTGGNSRTLKAQTAGAIGDALTVFGVVGLAAPELLAIGTDLQSLGLTASGIILSIAARLVTIFARLSDWKAKGV
jgi:uncharacterized protein (TIGR02594 family)